MSDLTPNAAVAASGEPTLPGTSAPTAPAPSGAAAPLSPAPKFSARAFEQSLGAGRSEPPAPGTAAAEPAQTAPATSPSPAEPAPAAVLDAQGRAHDPATGHFLPSEGSPDTQAASGSPADTAEPAAAPGPQGVLRIEISPDHPIREMGLDALVASDPQQERAMRALLNSYTRRQEVDSAQQYAAQTHAENLRLQAELRAQQRWESEADPATLDAIRAVEEVDPALAALMRRGLENGRAELAEQEFQTLSQQAEAQQHAAIERQWDASTWDHAQGTLERIGLGEVARLPGFTGLFGTALQSFKAALGPQIERGLQTPAGTDPGQFLQSQFVHHLMPYLVSDPSASAVVQRIQAERQAEAARQAEAERQRVLQQGAEQAQREAEARARQEAEQAALRAATNPMGNVSPGQVYRGPAQTGERMNARALDRLMTSRR